MDFNIEFIREMIDKGNVTWTQHCILRMNEREITPNDINNCIKYGKIIEEYYLDNPSCLVFGLDIHGKYLHVVVGVYPNKIALITTYHPNNDTFEDDFITRKR